MKRALLVAALTLLAACGTRLQNEPVPQNDGGVRLGACTVYSAMVNGYDVIASPDCYVAR